MSVISNSLEKAIRTSNVVVLRSDDEIESISTKKFLKQKVDPHHSGL